MIQACQLLCFPFALDVDRDILALVMEAVRDSQIPAQLLQVPSWPCVSLPPPILWRHLPKLQPPMRGTTSHHAGGFCPHRAHSGAMQPSEQLGWQLSWQLSSALTCWQPSAAA